ncbi:peptidase M15 [Nostoc sp. WHI]|nr:peptidase M15 [Nostoc sp. WHI]
MNLSTNFKLWEFVISPTADLLRVDNTPTPGEIRNLERLCQQILQPARDALGPLKINSGFRSEELNKAVGGANNSAHRQGLAADVVPLNVGTKQLAKWVNDNCEFDQIILEFGTLDNPRWIHLSAEPRNRRQVLRATSSSGRTVYNPIELTA